VGRALADALLRPTDAPRRIFALSDEIAARLYSFATNTLLIAAVGASLNVIHRSLGAPRILVTATSVLMAGLIAANIIYGLMKTRGDTSTAKDDIAPNWLRFSLWIASVVILGAVVTGYVWLASFLTSRLIHAAIVIAAAYALLNLINAYFGEGMHANSTRGRSLASTLGIRSSSLDLAAVLLAGAARVFIVIVALFLVLGNWGTSLTDLITSFDRASFGIEFGKLRISLYDIFSAVLILIAGILMARMLQRWLNNAVLPRTRLDASLKNSIATIAGYAGVIAAISFGLARLGLNLENIALIAGALSVGIGFGLQAIVSNFVSGLILLTERPIKVGDMVSVKGNEGIVRRISVRSTEVETYDRASVIIPNSELITSAVTNWTHKDLLARVTVQVGVAYDSDTEKVREILIEEARRHPRVLTDPEPVVLFMAFGPSSLDMELRCIVDSANFRLSTKSDLHFAILKSFRENGIDIPFPQQDMRIVESTGKGGFSVRDTSNAEAQEPPAQENLPRPGAASKR
jgi:small-conductance mechanosensitive channel